MTFDAVKFLISSTFLMLLLNNVSMCNADETSVSCLKLIKDSVQDLYGHLESWNFTRSICSFIGISCWNAIDDKVLSVQLSGLGLKGQFPRGIVHCTSLTTLDLSGNMLSGPLPIDIWGKNFITYLDLSYNQFSGTIPPEITRCRYLNVLLLQNNHLQGPIPQEIRFMDRLKVFNVANNTLTGPVPDFRNSVISAEFYANNEGLCGGPLQACSVDPNLKRGKGDMFSNGIFTAFSMGWAFGISFFVIGYFFGIPRVPVVICIRKWKLIRSKRRVQN